MLCKACFSPSLCVFHTIWVLLLGGWLPRGPGHNLLMHFSSLSSSRMFVPLPSSRCLAEGNRICWWLIFDPRCPLRPNLLNPTLACAVCPTCIPKVCSKVYVLCAYKHSFPSSSTPKQVVEAMHGMQSHAKSSSDKYFGMWGPFKCFCHLGPKQRQQVVFFFKQRSGFECFGHPTQGGAKIQRGKSALEKDSRSLLV